MNGYLPEHSSSAQASADHFIGMLSAFTDLIRLRILRLLEQQPQTGLTVGELADVLKLPQSTVSRHLKTLVEAGLSQSTRDGTSMVYRLSPQSGHNAARQLRDMAKNYLNHEPLAAMDSQRLAMILRQREEATSKFFGKAAPQWDQIRKEWFGDTFHLEGMLSLLNPDWVVADLGTGTGAMLPLIAPHVKLVMAVDPSQAMLKNARQRVKEQSLANVELRQGTLEQLPIEDQAIDVALITLVLHHVVNPAAAFAEIKRILRPGGIILIVDLQPHHVDMFKEKMEHRWMGFSQEQLTAWLASAGFGKIRWRALPAQTARSKENQTPVPDLFSLRAEII